MSDLVYTVVCLCVCVCVCVGGVTSRDYVLGVDYLTSGLAAVCPGSFYYSILSIAS